MTNKPKVSIVVPIYNVEKYLRECLDSILAQTLKDIEIIAIDDGSPDNCGKIIDEYAKKDKRLKAIHQKNSGYTTAVNKGIQLAKGEYIGIIESDDWIEPNMYEVLYKNAKENNTDVTKGGFWKYNSTLPKKKQNEYYKNPSKIDLRLAPKTVFNITEWPQLLAFHASIWSSIYKSSFIKKIKLADTAGASYQDFPFMVEVLCKAKRISVVSDGFVHWRNDPDQGNSTSAKGKKLMLMADNSATGVKIVEKCGLMEELKEPLYAHILWANTTFFLNISKKYQKEYYEKLRKIFQPVINDKNFKYKYFTDYDKVFLRLITTPNWAITKSILYATKARRFIRHNGKRTLQFLHLYKKD
ncbi:glycosyltransferase [Candidatus Saccharibacteria bacterium]|nr:glycosyltransferase [Candidatus Saccharibacteria bacterium]